MGNPHLFNQQILLNVDYMFQAMLKAIVEKRRIECRSLLPRVFMLVAVIRHNHKVVKEDPELTTSHRHTKSITIYRAIPPKEDLKAD